MKKTYVIFVLVISTLLISGCANDPYFWQKVGRLGEIMQQSGNSTYQNNQQAYQQQMVSQPMVMQQQAPSGCIWQWDCTTTPCRQVPICNSALDIVPPRPPSIAPIPAPTIKPIPTPTIAPIGTTQCNQRYICNGNDCRWQNVCQ